MPQFTVRKGQDAYVFYKTTVDAFDEREANSIAGSRSYEGRWLQDGYAEFDDYALFDEETVLADDTADIESVIFELTPRERDTVLASLRMYQASTEDMRIPYLDIATDEDLSDDQIDDLCERLNK